MITKLNEWQKAKRATIQGVPLADISTALPTFQSTWHTKHHVLISTILWWGQGGHSRFHSTGPKTVSDLSHITQQRAQRSNRHQLLTSESLQMLPKLSSSAAAPLRINKFKSKVTLWELLLWSIICGWLSSLSASVLGHRLACIYEPQRWWYSSEVLIVAGLLLLVVTILVIAAAAGAAVMTKANMVLIICQALS